MPAAHAAELGVLHLHSGIGQPLDAEIDLMGIRPEDAQTLVLHPGGREAYQAAGLPYGASTTSLRTTLIQRQDGSYAVHVSSTVPHSDPIADVIVALAGPGGERVAAYTVLLSPPGRAGAPDTFLQTQRNVTPALRVSPASSTAAQRVNTPPVTTASAPVAMTASASQPRAQQPSTTTTTSANSTTSATPPASERDEATASTYTIKAGDSLSGIALNTSPDQKDISSGQAQLALYRNNPQAFIGGNINQLRVGATLHLPSQEQARAVTRSDADRQIRALTQANAAAPVGAKQPPETDASTHTQARPIPADAAGKDTLRLSAAGTQDRMAEQLNDELVAAKQRIRELESRLAQVEQNVADMRRLAALKSGATPAAAQGSPKPADDASGTPRVDGTTLATDETPLWMRADIVGPAVGVLLAALAGALVFYRVRMRKVQSALTTIYTQFNEGDPLTERGRPQQRNDQKAKAQRAIPRNAVTTQ
ncbi:type IV pilus assembly protein FimV (plasmid) [Ralstonia sp. 25C]|uniref:type IV pilus assembly protein FimV n=1 Tax=Ralstonia sp. 25C TaxID=3447363 RepID=UPI003F755FB0